MNGKNKNLYFFYNFEKIFIIILFLYFLFFLQYQNIFIIFNYIRDGFPGNLLLAYHGNEGYREDVLLYFAKCKNTFNGNGFFYDHGNILNTDTQLTPYPYLQLLICNIFPFIAFGNDNIMLIILYSIPAVTYFFVYKICNLFIQKKFLCYSLSFFSLITVYEVFRFNSPSITYLLFTINLYLLFLIDLKKSAKFLYLVSLFTALQTWVYFYNFIVLSPVLFFILLKNFYFYNEDKKTIKLSLLTFFLFASLYFLFAFNLKNEIPIDYFQKIMWSNDYNEMKNFNIQTQITGRYFYMTIFTLIMILIFLANFLKEYKFRFFNTVSNEIFIKKSNFTILSILFFFSVIFPKLLEFTINFPQPQNLFYRIGVFQLSLIFGLFIYFFGKKIFNFSFKNNKLYEILFCFLIISLAIIFSLKNINQNIKGLNAEEYVLAKSEKKILDVFQQNISDNCSALVDNKKFRFLLTTSTHCRILRADIFKSNVSINELVERYVFADIILNKSIYETLENFNLDFKILENIRTYCYFYLKKKTNKNMNRLSYVNRIYHFGKCNPINLKTKIIKIYEMISKNKDAFIRKYNIKYLIKDDKIFTLKNSKYIKIYSLN